MYRVSPFVSHFAKALLLGVAVATLWVNIAPAGYYDMIEWRLLERWLPPVLEGLTVVSLVSDGLMGLFLFFIGKELWEALILERSAQPGQRRLLAVGMTTGGLLGGAAVWLLMTGALQGLEGIPPRAGWPVPLGSEVVLGYLAGRVALGAGHPALHVLLLVAISSNLLGLALLGPGQPDRLLHLHWLAMPLIASLMVWRLYGRRPPEAASERRRRLGLMLWPYVLAGAVGWIGVALSGLPPALGLLPIIPAVAHADRSFGVFAEAELFLHDPLNRLAHLLARPLVGVLFLLGLTRGGVDLGALGPTTGCVLAALWLGKPLGVLAGAAVTARLIGAGGLPPGVRPRDIGLIALIMGMGFTVPSLAIAASLPGGTMQEAARLGLALSLLAGPAAMLVAHRWRA